MKEDIKTNFTQYQTGTFDKRNWGIQERFDYI